MSGNSPAEERATELLGRVLSDRYRLDELLAKGSMGAVYRGYHLKMRKVVAIKVLHPDIENFPEMVARFEREAVVGAHLDHPNVAGASDMGTFDRGSYFLVQELVRGPTLRDLIDREAPLRPRRAVRLAGQLLSALAAAHRLEIVHRDLKPLNVMVDTTADERVKLVDFGLARVPLGQIAPSGDIADHERLSAPDMVFGSVAYMAPEIAEGMDAVDARSDLYSAGIILYEMLSGLHPWDPCAPLEMLMHHRSSPVPRISDRNPKAQVPPAIEAVVMRLLAKDPNERYPDADSAIEALRAGEPDLEASDARAFAAPRPDTPRFSPRALATGAALTIAGAAAVIGLVAVITRGEKPAAHPATAAPSQAESASAEPETSAPPAPPPREDIAASLARDLLASTRAGAAAADAAPILVALADADPKALSDPSLRDAAKKVAIASTALSKDKADEIFYVLSYRFGSPGLDVVYDVSRDPAAGRAAGRASAILDRQGLSARASPGLRITVELRKASCRQKPLLFSRAAKEGDARTLAALKELMPPACETDGSSCCFRRHVGLEKAIEVLRALPSPPPAP